MSDQGVFSNPESGSSENRNEKVNKAFGSLKRADEQLSSQDEERLRYIREAVTTGDKAKIEEHLTSAKQESSWIYEELMKHPEISAILRELSIMGF